MSNSVRPHRRQPTRLPHPWDSPGKNTGVGCHFLLQCMKVKSESEVAQSCLIPSDPMDCSPPGSSVHGTFQAKVLEWGAIESSSANGLLGSRPQKASEQPGFHPYWEVWRQGSSHPRGKEAEAYLPSPRVVTLPACLVGGQSPKVWPASI